jgi:hypothetical protein
VLAIALLSAACAGDPTIKNRRGDVTGRSFEFQGGAQGEWNVRFRGDSFWAAFDDGGKITDFESVKLEEREAERLWSLIEAARFDKRKSSRRRASDEEEPLYMFWVAPEEAGLRDERPPLVEIWADDVYNDKTLTRLIRYMGKLIQKYHKKKPVL